MRKTVLALVLVGLIAGTASATVSNEWRGDSYSPKSVDNDWSNGANWTLNHAPTTGEAVEWRYASGTRTITMNGVTASTGAMTCGVWADGDTAALTITGGSNYTTTGTFGLYNSADNTHPLNAVANVIFNLNGGSTMTLAGDGQIGRIMTSGYGSPSSHCTLNIDGAGTVLNQTSGYWWMGWGNNLTEQIAMNITNGAVVHFAGLAFQPDTTNKPVIYLGVGSSFTIKTNRTGAVAGYISANELKAYNGVGTISSSYSAGTDLTTVVCTPEPATMVLLGLGGLIFARKK